MKQFLRREVKNGQDTSFWYDTWSKLGRLKDVLGERGIIVMGNSGNAVVADVLGNHRRRRHRERILNEIEDEIETLRLEPSQDEDIPLWKQKEGIYANMFSSKKTWLQLRTFSSSSGSRSQHQNTPFWSGLLCVTGYKHVIGCRCGMGWLIRCVFSAMKQTKPAAICSLAAGSQNRFRRHWREVFFMEGLLRNGMT